jgi:hypothetical protein
LKIVCQKATTFYVGWLSMYSKMGSPDLPEFAAWRRQIFVLVKVLILYLFTTVKAARIKLCQCRYFCEIIGLTVCRSTTMQDAANKAPCFSYTDNCCPCVSVTDKERSALCTVTCKQILRASSCEFWLIRASPHKSHSFLTKDFKNLKSVGVP